MLPWHRSLRSVFDARTPLSTVSTLEHVPTLPLVTVALKCHIVSLSCVYLILCITFDEV